MDSTGQYDNPRSTNQGPHGSNIMNTMDPRVDSDGSRGTGLGATTGTTGHTGTTAHTGTTGHTGVGSGMATGAGGAHYNDPQSSNIGPHSSNAMNTLDPRVDSDASRMTGHGTTTGAGYTGVGTGTGTAHHAHGTTHGTTHHTTGAGAYGDNPQSSNLGPHSSNTMNKMDPRVDSDGSKAGYGATGTTGHVGAGHTTTGHTGHHTTGHTGQHTTGATGISTTAAGTGNAPNTAGPHKSDLLNKLDPRVDSDLDGSKTVGGNKTFT